MVLKTILLNERSQGQYYSIKRSQGQYYKHHRGLKGIISIIVIRLQNIQCNITPLSNANHVALYRG